MYSSYSPLTTPAAVQSIPRTELKWFTKLAVDWDDDQQLIVQLNVSSLALVGPDSKLAVQTGVYLIHVGGAAPGSRGWLVDGGEQHGRVVRQRAPIESLVGEACHSALQWWKDRMVGDDGMADVRVEQAIVGGLVGVLTIC